MVAMGNIMIHVDNHASPSGPTLVYWVVIYHNFLATMHVHVGVSTTFMASLEV